VNREISEQQVPWRDSVAALDEPSIVFVVDTGRYLLYSNPFSANGPDLDDEVLYAAAGSPSVLDLIAERPERVPYLQEASVAAPELGPREDPYDLDVRLAPIEVVRGTGIDLRVAVEPPPGTVATEVTVSSDLASVTEERSGDRSTSITLRLGEGGDLDVAERGNVTVTARFRDADGEVISVRRLTPYRVAGSALEVLTPIEAQRRERLDEDTLQWRHVIALDELTVTATPAP
jgi:hypothetical protein